MRLVRFLSRVAFICNICFLVASFTQWLPALPEGLASDIVVLGYLVAIIVNLIVNLIVLLLLPFGKLRGVPVWLLIVNGLFFIAQIILFYLNQHLH